MTGLEALVLRGWLRAVAPRLTDHPRAPLGELAAEAVAALAPNYGGRDRLASALANTLRRSASTGALNLAGDAEANARLAGACMEAEGHFQRLVAGKVTDLEGALAALLARLPGADARAQELAAEALEAFEAQVLEVLPREGPYGLKPAVALLAARAASLPPELARLAHRDRGTALSLLGRHSEARRAFLDSGDTLRAMLEASDEALAAGDRAGAQARIEETLATARTAGDGRTEGAALRKLAMLVGGQGDVPAAEGLLREAALAFRAAGDGRGEAESVEALSHSAADRGQIDRAVTLLGAVRRLHRERAFAPGEGRALRLAGRLLCENGRPVEGMVMLFQARTIAEAADPHIEHPLEHYITGFEETLSAEEFSRVEQALAQDWERQINVAFAAARCRAPDALEGL